MKNRFVVLFAAIFCVSSVFALINTDDIEAVRARTEKSSTDLSASDKAVITRFWDTASNTMPLAESAREIVEIRRQLEEQKGTEPLSFYASAYIAVAREKLQAALENVERLSDPERKELIKRNLMILASQLKSAKLAPLALQKINDKDDVVRYWAVKAVTQPEVVSQLVSDLTGDDQVLDDIIKAMNTRLDFEKDCRIQDMMVTFASTVNNQASRQLLTKIADNRFKAYMDWSVQDDIIDTKLLLAMSRIIATSQDATVVSQIAQKFAMLYSVAIQRYTLGQNVLTEEQIVMLKTLIAEVAETGLDKTMGVSNRIVDSLRRNSGLEREFEALFGDRMRSGELGIKYKFDYGKDDSGKAITAPPTLSAPPATEAAQN